MNNLKTNTEWLRANTLKVVRDVGVDRENKTINGFLVAEAGPFRSEGRGEFNSDSLSTIVSLMRSEPQGLKSRFTHPTLSNDGLGSFLGRATNPRQDSVLRGGKQVDVVRADLHLSETAFESNPNGNLGDYLLNLAEEDPDAMGASLVLKTKEEYRMDNKGRPMRDDNGNELPPLWYPTELHAIDIVDTGDATRAFLSTDGLRDEIVRKGSELLDRQFAGCSREVVEARCNAWLDRYLAMRYGPENKPQRTEGTAAKLRRIRRRNRRN